MSTPGYIPGGHWAECQRCGEILRHYDLRKEWTGVLVCNDCYEPRNEQELIRVKTEEPVRGLVSPESPDVYVVSLPIAGVAVAGIAIAGGVLGITDIPSGTFGDYL